jgi:hypothetical protein
MQLKVPKRVLVDALLVPPQSQTFVISSAFDECIGDNVLIEGLAHEQYGRRHQHSGENYDTPHNIRCRCAT